MQEQSIWKIRVLFHFNILLLVIISFGRLQAQGNLNEIFYGHNAWMPDQIGNTASCPGGTTNPCQLFGKLHQLWQEVKRSNTGIVRFGGINPDNNYPTNAQYIKMIDSIRAAGAEPLLQVSFWNGTYTAEQAATLVDYINNTMGRQVRYWTIGNEPDLKYSNHNTPAQVAAYIKSFAMAMKDVDPQIKIVAPDVAWYNPSIFYGNGSTGILIPGGANDITGKPAGKSYYYVDYISFHSYLGNGSHTRNDVVVNFPQTFRNQLDELTTRLNTANTFHSRSGEDALRSAVTEFHITWQNPGTNNVGGVGAHGFVVGQYWAELSGIGLSKGCAFMNPWSVHESSGSRNEYDLGYLDGNGPFIPRSTYYHMQMMGKHMKGDYLQGSTNRTNVKAFATRDAQNICVMILNQETATDCNFTLRFDNNTVSGSDILKINISAGIAREFLERIPAKSSALYIFDLAGNPVARYVYSESDASANPVRPPSYQVYDEFLHLNGLLKTAAAPGWIIENKEWNKAYYSLNREGADLKVSADVSSNNTTRKFTRIFARTAVRPSGGTLDLGSSTVLHLRLKTTASECSLRVELQDGLGNITSEAPMLINPVNNSGNYIIYTYDFESAFSCGASCSVDNAAISAINFYVSYSSAAFNNVFEIGGIDFKLLFPPPEITEISGPDRVNKFETGVVFSVPVTDNTTYNWVLPAGAVIVSGEGTNSIVVDFGSTGGTVSVEATNPNGTTVLFLEVEMESPASVGTKNGAITAKAYPNPFKSEITIHIPDPSSRIMKIKVTDMKGYTWQVLEDERTNTDIIIGKDLLPGIYLISAEYEGMMVWFRITKF